ncbi:energy-coupling factor ABC transporter ATP-binding protein [Undibacterium sp.]|uniref:ABC transporter ATP-binding protein n=1 Tax=Undibacterium sp. TaxID=1914977 RepID=UPI0025E3D6E2|nr:energy-coupling factor ABC transporter ATP-binding protein [Undibacterium sp.]
MSILLQLQGLRKPCGTQSQQSPAREWLLDIASLTIETQSAYVLTGINGAGKSTLLRILSGLDQAQIAQAQFRGAAIDWAAYPRVLRDSIVYVHQHPIMFADTVAGNILYGLKLRGIPLAQQKIALQQALAWAGIAHLREQLATTLSGGEKQRVALARAKVLHPALLLLDEPTSNLDGEAREQVIALIPDLIKEGSSVIMVCHDRDLIALPGVHRLKLRDGKLENR